MTGTDPEAPPASTTHELALRIQQAWNQEFTHAPASAVDYQMAVIAAETVRAAIAAQQPAAVTAESLAAALDSQIPVIEMGGTLLRRPAHPHDLAVQLLAAIDPQLTRNPPAAAAP